MDNAHWVKCYISMVSDRTVTR